MKKKSDKQASEAEVPKLIEYDEFIEKAVTYLEEQGMIDSSQGITITAGTSDPQPAKNP
jgi:hypothetical protein